MAILWEKWPISKRMPIGENMPIFSQFKGGRLNDLTLNGGRYAYISINNNIG